MKNYTGQLLKLIERFPQKKVAVWGDLILDEYLYGNTRRISREAPVLILSHSSNEFFLGGGGNALFNIRALGAEPIPIGVIGNDEAGEKVIHIMQQSGISSDLIERKDDYSTPRKTRILAGEENTRKQQILRIDKEEKVPADPALREQLKTILLEAGIKADALLISDYNYLTVTPDIFKEILPLYKRNGIPIALDSRFRILEFKGATVITPNEPETESALQRDVASSDYGLDEIGRSLLEQTGSEAVLLTRGSKGMVLFESTAPPLSIPVFGTTDIVDVTGAGDTVICVFTLALTAGATFKEAAMLANYAGGIVVMKKGTSTLSLSELREAIITGH